MQQLYTLIKNQLASLISAIPLDGIRLARRSAALVASEGHIPSGFTLIELLVVIAILGILASVVLVAINPAQRIAEANDTKMKSAVSSVATAVEACYTHMATGLYTNCASGPNLVTSGFLKVTPNPLPTFKLKTNSPANTELKVYGQLTAKSARPAGCSTNPYIIYSTIDGSTTISCAAPLAF